MKCLYIYGWCVTLNEFFTLLFDQSISFIVLLIQWLKKYFGTYFMCLLYEMLAIPEFNQLVICIIRHAFDTVLGKNLKNQ